MSRNLEWLFPYRRRDGVRLARWALALALAALVAGQFGAVAPPVDILSHFSGHLIGVMIAAVLALLWRRGAGVILTLGIAATVALHGMLASNVFRAHAGTATLAPGTVKIVSLNAWKWNDRIARIESFLRSADADIVLLYEVAGRKRELLRRLLPLYPYQQECADVRDCHLALLSKRPWRQAGVQARAPGKVRMAWATFGEGGRSFSIVGAHLAKPIEAPWQQVREIDDLGRHVRRLPGPVILAGDMNATPWSAAFDRIADRSGLRKLRGIRPTWPTAYLLPPQLAIDHFFASAGVRVDSVSVGARVGSDHLPLIGVFRIPPATAEGLPPT